MSPLETKAITPPPLPLRGEKGVEVGCGVLVGGSGVSVGKGVAVGGSGVRVGVGGMAVAVGGCGVLVATTAISVAVGGAGVTVGAAGPQPVTRSDTSRINASARWQVDMGPFPPGGLDTFTEISS
jgi:hypothetical protein